MKSRLTNKISERAKEVSAEPFRLALNLPKGVIRLSGGEPDFETPSFVREAAKKALDDGFTHYSPSAGYEDLRKAVADKLHRENGIVCDYEREVVITPGSSSGIFMALLSLLNPGDEVLVTDPAWFHYTTLVRLCGATPVDLPVKLGEKVCLDLEDAEERVTDRTKALILNSPCNPTGMMIPKDELKAISEFVERNDLTVISDEVYEKITYPGNTHTSPASLSALRERTLTSNGFSKGYAMTGWRVGYLAGPAEIIEKVTALNGYILVCPSSVSQQAALVALTDTRMNAAISGMVDRFTKRREMVLDALADLPGIRAYPPQGTFYAWIDVSKTGMSSEQFTYKLIESERVGLLPGNLFGGRGKGHVRICFATGEDLLAQALERIRRFILRKS